MELILYSKPGCHLCEGLEEKLSQVKEPKINLEIRDITTNDQWFAAYQYEIPVLVWRSPRDYLSGAPLEEITLPRLPPRAPASQLEKLLQQYISPQKKGGEGENPSPAVSDI